MYLVMLALLVANLIATGALLIVTLTRRHATGSGGGSSSEAAAASHEAAHALAATVRQDLSAQRSELGQALAQSQAQADARAEAAAGSASQLREQVSLTLTQLSDRFHSSSRATLQSQTELQQTVASRFEELRASNEKRIEGLQQSLRSELEKLRQGNETKLEQMRETVDEKLQSTLERRLGDSFKLVSDRLEQVQKGLGEMQSLASDVGGLKRVLTNVKSRGSWGEVQLARQLEDMLTPEQYEENVAVRPDSSERVEFAVKLPGRGENDVPVWLPIDSKFPQEDYERLLVAQETGEPEAIESASKTVERVIIGQAKLIHDKYVHPPHSTDFAIMYLPTEGLFAEALRRPGLASRIQTEYRVTIAGPTVLMSLLNSLQLGFRTLAIEQRSAEVWQVLSAEKQEFQKYGRVWEKLGKQLATAQNTVEEAGRRTRAVERQLRGVETLQSSADPDGAPPLEGFFPLDAEEPGAI